MKKKIVKKILIILLIIISIALVLSLIHIMKNYIIVKKVEKNISTYLDSTNYHIKINQTDDKNKDLKIVVNYYKKDDKEVVVLERYKNDELSKIFEQA